MTPTTYKSRYRYVLVPLDHPIATRSGKIPMHRKVLWEKIGPGPHPCHWCGKPVDWMPGEHTREGALQTDHKDNDGQNNDPANLVPSCHTCNVERGRDARFEDAPFIITNGIRESATEMVCQAPSCGQPFLIATKHLKNPKKGKYCSRECMYARNR